MKHDGLGVLLEGVLHPWAKSSQFHLLACEPIVFGEIMLRRSFGHLGFQFPVDRVVLLFDYVRRNVKGDTVGESVAKVRKMLKPFIKLAR